MEDMVDRVIKLELDEIETYGFPLDEVFGLEINYDNVKYCLITKLASNNKNLICFGPGAFQRDQRTSDGKLITPPFFSRWKWHKYFKESFISYADPIFFYDEEIKVGWFVGTKDTWYLEVVSQIIKKITINQQIKNDNILFFSSSAGGFASICLGTLIKGSKVLVNNTQFNVLHYKKIHVDPLFEFLQKDFPDLSRSQIEDHLKYRLDVIELFKRENYVPNITYYVNTASDIDIYDHCIPFIEELKELPQFNNYLTIYFYKEVKEKTHFPMETNATVKFIMEYVKQYLYNEEESFDNNLENNLIKSTERITKENDSHKLKISSLEKENEELLSKNNSLEKTNDEMLNSKSWKLTKPLRAFINLFL